MSNQRIILPFQSKLRLEGLYRLQVRDGASGRLSRDTGWFRNLILDSGLNRLGTGVPVSGMAIGTGTAAPGVGDTQLSSLAAFTTTVAPAGSTTGNEGSPNYASWRQWSYRFGAGSLNGNYSEIGAGWLSASMFSRALILDGGGSPTTISVLSTESLDAYYMLRLVPDLTPHTSVVVISGTSYNVTRKPAQVSSSTWGISGISEIRWLNSNTVAYNGSIGAVTGTPSGTSAQTTSNSNDTYVNNSLERTGTISFALTEGNVAGGIKSIQTVGNYCAYQYEFDTAIPKDSTKVLTLNGKIAWSR